uniref:Type III effector protein n=1 Tax=Ganoderma boninense TaxID=34458 RepID=A0A5K1JUR5_9APHY|nr:Putative type III effector protein [Ganoderma boninense]
MEAFAKKAGRNIFARNLQQYEPKDPLYEMYIDDRGRQRRRKRDMPPGLSKRDMKVLKSVQRRAHYLDKGFHICGMRFGWTFVIGIIPGAGDAADVALNYLLVVRKAKQAEDRIPGWLLSRMLVNNAVSAGVGLVPIVGDIILAMYKANSRNAGLLEEYLRVRGEEFLKPEAERKQNVKDVKPGAGRKPNEVIPIPGEEPLKPSRTASALNTAGGWFRRGSKGTKKDKSKNKTENGGAEPETSEATPVLAVSSSSDRGRFVEDVPPTTQTNTVKHQ